MSCIPSPSQGDVMDSKPQSLCSPFLCTAANGRGGPRQRSSSPETGDARPKPPVKPKPCVLPKPAMPAKPTPVLRQALSEVPSAEKINLLAGPKPYSSGAGNSVKRLSFSFKCPPKEATNGKEVSPPFSSATKPSAGGGEGPGSTRQPSAAAGASVDECGELYSVRRCAVPFKVKPVPGAAKPERFPGTTVEEILAKIEKPSKEGPEGPEKPRLVRASLSQEGGTAVQLGPKGYAAFRRCSSGGEGGGVEPKGPVCGASHEENSLSRSKEDATSSNGQHAPESEQPSTERDLCFHSRDSSSSPPSLSCDEGQPGLRSSPSPPGVSVPQTSQPLAKLSSGVTPGSPEAPAEPAQPPGAPCLPEDSHSTQAELPPGSPDVIKPLRTPTEEFCGLAQAPGSPLALADPCPPGSPSVSVEASLSPCPPSPSARGPEVLLLPGPSLSLAFTPPADHRSETPSWLLGISESPGSPDTHSDSCVGSDQPPGSPSHAQESRLLSRSQDSPKKHTQALPAEDKAPHLSQLPLRRASEGVVEPQGRKGKQELGRSLAALPRGGPHLEQAAVGESSWSLSQSFEWSFPNRALVCGGGRLGSPPRSPIAEAEDPGLLETELGGNISSPERSYEGRSSEGLSGRGDETEACGSSPGCRDSWSQAVGQPESSSVLLQGPAPGGPSGGRQPSSHERKGPLVATECGFQEEDEGLPPFVPVHEEGALQGMEPLPNVEQSAPPVQPCISFSEDVQMQTAVSGQENECTLDLVQESKTSDADPPRGAEQDPSSCWLDELLASPPPSADDTKRRSKPKLDDPTGPEDLLGWSRKDLCSEFGIGETGRSVAFDVGWAEEALGSKAGWPDETEQDLEFGTGKWDWLSSYSAGNADRQDIPQDWAGGTPLLGNSNQGQEDWLTAYGSSCAGQQTGKPDWSSRYDTDAAECQNTEPYARKRGWPRLCSEADHGSREFAVGNTDWSSQCIGSAAAAAADRTDWPSSAESASCVDSEANTQASDESSQGSHTHHQDAQLSLTGPDGGRGPYQEAAFRACQSGWPTETSADARATGLQMGFSDQQSEQPSKCRASHSASQVNSQQHPQPDAYGFSDASCPESELSAEQSDWPTSFGVGVAQCQGSDSSVGKPDSIDGHKGSQVGWEREVGIVSGGSTPGFGAGDAEFRAQKTVWTDAYVLGGTDPQSSDFSAGARDWVKGTDVSGTERKMQCSAARKDQGGSFDPRDMSGLRMTMDLVETSDSLMDQTRDLGTVAMDESRGVGEGQSDWTQDLSLRGISLSGLSKADSPDESREPTEEQPDWLSALALARLSAPSGAGLVNPELPREPGVGQADLAYRPGIESKDVSDERSKGLEGAEEAGPMEMDWASERRKERHDQSSCSGAPCLGGGEGQHPGTSEDPGESRAPHSEQLSTPSHLLEEMVANSAVEEVAQQKRPTSSHSCRSGEEGRLGTLTDDQMTAAEKTRASPASVEVQEDEEVRSNGDGGISQLDSRNCSQPPLEARRLSHPEQSGSQAEEPVSQEGHTTDGAGAPSGETPIFSVDTEVLDATAYRDRANLGRKRGHRAPVTRSGGALSDSWMFKDSTEPQVAPVHSDEESSEEPRSRRPQSSPLSKGVKVPLFSGLNPSALKAKLRGRNRSAEEGDSHREAKPSPAKEAHNVQRSKSCKMASGKPLGLPPKPEKASGSEASSPNWLQVLKLKKKKS